MEEELIWSSY